MPQGPRGASSTLADLRRAATAPSSGWWANFDKYIVSLLKAWFGDAATAENDYGFGRLPKITGNHSHFPTMLRALDGGLDGLFVMGQNPAVGSQHAGLQRRALANLKWLVVRDLVRARDRELLARRARGALGRAAHRGHPDRGLPDARRLARREGRARSRTRSGCCSSATRRSTRPATPARSCGSCTTCSSACSAHYAGSDGRARLADRQPQLGLPRARRDRASPTPRPCCKRDQRLRRRDRRPGRRLRRSSRTTARPPAAAGSTPASSPTASTRRAGATRATSTTPGGWVSPEWAWAWPANRRILYNRASRRPRGQAVVGAQEVRLVGRGGRQVDRLRRPRLPGRQAAGLPAGRRRQGHGRDRRRRPVHHDGRRQRLAVRARAACSTARCRRTTSRIESPVDEPALPGDRARTRRRCAGTAPDNPARRDRRPALPARGHDLPAHRAPHRGRR